MNKAFVFQHNYTGIQIFVYHCKDAILAKTKFPLIVTNSDDWSYIGEKIAEFCDEE